MPKSKYMDKVRKTRASPIPKKKAARVPPKHIKAKKAVSDYMKKNSHRHVWVSELAEKLKLDLGTLVKVLNQLYNEGHIKKATA